MIVVTGGAGFIGSNLVRGLNRAGFEDLVVVDNMTNASKFRNLVGTRIADYLDKEDFLSRVVAGDRALEDIDVVFHQGACTSTTETDGRYMMRNNFEYSKVLLAFCRERRVPFIYASSAAVYGGSAEFVEASANESPLNVYGYSKLLFDEVVRRLPSDGGSQVVGLRYFNVYGPRESHKGPMASLVRQLDVQVATTGKARLFGATPGYDPGEQRRDFVFVEDVVEVNLWFLRHPECSGIFNCGTGTSRSFNDLAHEVVRFQGAGEIEYFPFPESLTGHYQSFTQADLAGLRAAGYDAEFTPLEKGVSEYLSWRRRQVDS